MRASSSAVRGPVVSQPDRSVSATASISASVIAGGWNERNSDRFAETYGICGDEAYAVRRGGRAGEGFCTGRGSHEHGARTVASPPERREHVPGSTVDPH